MAIDLKRILTDFGIPFQSSGPEIGRGWIGIQCPFCGDDKTHLGYNESKNLLTCWKCGPKRIFPTLKKLLNKDSQEIEKIIKNYGIYIEESPYQKPTSKSLILPKEFGTLKESHRKYLKARGFDPDNIISHWNILATGNNCPGYENRIIIPIYQGGKLVSFHSRDITGKASTPKKACKSEKEVIHFKDTLYGYDRVKSNTVIVSEGAFDVWRWGYGAVCTWGIKFSERQVDLLSTFKNIFIIFDSETEDNPEKQAAEQAEKLANKLSIFQNVWIVDELGSDPADLSQRKADAIKRRLYQLLQGEKNVPSTKKVQV